MPDTPTQLLNEGKAYRCFCTPEELEAERKQLAEKNLTQVYSGRCRSLKPKAVNKLLEAGTPYAVRLKIGEEPLRFHDLVRGTVEFPAEAVSDPILVRSAQPDELGMPVYNYVVTIDDALMGSPMSSAATTTSPIRPSRSPSTRHSAGPSRNLPISPPSWAPIASGSPSGMAPPPSPASARWATCPKRC